LEAGIEEVAIGPAMSKKISDNKKYINQINKEALVRPMATPLIMSK